MAKILDGKKLAEKILGNLKERVVGRRLKLKLVAIQIGENPISEIFIRQKELACGKIGVSFQLFKYPSKISFPEIKKEIEKIVRNPRNSGIIIQLPLPKNLPAQKTLDLIPQEKDIDVLSEKSLGKFYHGTLSILPPTVSGIQYLLKNYKIKIKQKNVVILGAGELIGRPLALWLLQKMATVSVLNEFTKDAASFTKKADMLISGAGRPNLIKSQMVKKGVIIIDGGVSFYKSKLTGDIDVGSISKKASYVAPVPGGLGPMTVACLLENLINLSKI